MIVVDAVLIATIYVVLSLVISSSSNVEKVLLYTYSFFLALKYKILYHATACNVIFLYHLPTVLPTLQ